MTATGIIFILLAVALVIGELHTGAGLFLICGIAALIIGIVILFTQGSISLRINWGWVILLIILFIGLITFSILRIINTYHRQAATGEEDLKGKTAIVKETLNPEGTVFYQGELWNAVSKSGKIETREEVIIENVDGLMFYVVRKQKS